MLEPQHVANCKVVHRREALYDLMPKNAIVTEIGIFHGENALQIYQRSNPKHLYLIDKRIEERTRKSLSYENITFIEEYSHVALEECFENNFFDWAYLDTDHTYKTTQLELKVLEKKVKPTGRILGHDYLPQRKDAWYGVIPAVNEFCKSYDWEFEYFSLDAGGHFSFCIRKINS